MSVEMKCGRITECVSLVATIADMEISNEQFNTSPDFRSENNNWSSSQLNDSGVVTSQVSSSTYEMGCLNVDSVSALLASARSFTNSRLSKPVTQAQVAVQQAPSLLVSEEQSSSRSIYTESVRPNHFGKSILMKIIQFSVE